MRVASAVSSAILIIFVVALLALGAASSPSRPSSVAFVYGTEGHGSGVFIAADTVITAKHVLDGEAWIKVKDATGGIYDVAQIIFSESNDLAVIKLTKPANVEIAVVDCSLPPVLKELTAVGYPQDLRVQARIVRVAGYGYMEVDGVPAAMPVMWLDGSIIPGDSGGPVYSRSGVIGIMDGVMISFGGPSGLAFVIPLTDEPLVCEGT